MLNSVLHGPVEIAGQVALSAQALRLVGAQATSLAPQHQFGYKPEPDISPRAGWSLSSNAGRFARSRYAVITARQILKHDILHLHFGASYVSYF